MTGVINIDDRRESRPERGSQPDEAEGYRNKHSERPARRRAPELTEAERDAFAEFGLKTFEQEYAQLRRKTMAEDFSASTAAYALLRAQMATVIRSLSVMDRAFKASQGRNAYSYVAMHGLARELSHDLRAFGDQHEMADRVRRQAIQPLLQSVATDVVARIARARVKIHGRLRPAAAAMASQELVSLQDDMARVFADVEARASELVAGALSGPR